MQLTLISEQQNTTVIHRILIAMIACVVCFASVCDINGSDAAIDLLPQLQLLLLLLMLLMHVILTRPIGILSRQQQQQVLMGNDPKPT
jgi:uncharacterized membrane protein YoaK (UPF0700 family)